MRRGRREERAVVEKGGEITALREPRPGALAWEQAIFSAAEAGADAAPRAENTDSALDLLPAAWCCPPHFRAPSARAMIKPRTSRNMATESSTVMTTMPPVRAIASPMDSAFLPVRREEAGSSRQEGPPSCPRLPACLSSIHPASHPLIHVFIQPTNKSSDKHL